MHGLFHYLPGDIASQFFMLVDDQKHIDVVLRESERCFLDGRMGGDVYDRRGHHVPGFFLRNDPASKECLKAFFNLNQGLVPDGS